MVAAGLVLRGGYRVCSITDDEPEREALEAAVRAYRAQRQSGRWKLF